MEILDGIKKLFVKKDSHFQLFEKEAGVPTTPASYVNITSQSLFLPILDIVNCLKEAGRKFCHTCSIPRQK